jgi:hypothetical protein
VSETLFVRRTPTNPDPQATPALVGRKAALALGLNRYFTGKPCPAGHIAEKRVSDYGCMACARTKTRAWNEKLRAPGKLRAQQRRAFFASPEGIARKVAREKAADAARYIRKKDTIDAYNREWYEANKERKSKAQSDWHAQNKASINARKAEWSNANPELRRAAKLRRRAREAAAKGTVTAADLIQMIFDQGGECVYCKSALGKHYHADHIMPLVLGGGGGADNIQLTCATCNQRKSRLHPDVFARRIGISP